MEFCPEIAVLQSAFQLLQQKAGKDLGTLKKESCKDFTPIISTAVREICMGLETDNDPQDMLLWQQKTHLLVFYALVTKKYRAKQETRPGCVPVLSTLDTLTHPLPDISSSFYFELVKICSWEHCFIDSLSYLEPGLAVQLLQDAMEHCQTSPVADEDTNFVTLVLENLISTCLTQHLTPNSLLQTLAIDLYKKKKVIWTVYPDETDAEMNKSDGNTDQSTENILPLVNGKVNGKGSPGFDVELQQSNKFWGVFLENNADFLSVALEYTSRKYSENESDLCSSQGATRYLAQLLFLWYCCYVCHGFGSQTFDKWFVSNIGKVWKPKIVGKTQETWVLPTSVGFQTGQAAACSLNYNLIDGLIVQIPKDKLLEHILKCLLNVQTVLFEDNKEKAPELLMRDGNFEIALGIQIKACVLLRMFHGTLTADKYKSDETSSQIEECLSLVEKLCSKELLKGPHGAIRAQGNLVLKDPRGGVGAGKDRVGEYGVLKGPHGAVGAHGDSSVLLGDSWETDVTLSVVLWRIATSQPQAEACMELLLTEGCQSAWFLHSVYTVLEKEGRTLRCSPAKVLKLMKIASRIHGDAPRETTQRILHLIQTVFSELPFPDQDYIVMTVYKERPSEVDVFVTEDGFFTVNKTNVFNKLTAEKDDQVQQEIMQLCLTDPVSVVRQAVEICTRNEEQAVSSAKVLQHLAKTCGCRHETFHPGLSLLGLVVHEFITTVELSDKMQKHLTTFLTHVMQTESGPQALLSPVEFLQTTVLPHTSVATFGCSDTPITAKLSLDLLITSLTASCNKKCDWSKSDIEPVVLVVLLSQILQECVALWEEGDDDTSIAMGKEWTLGPARGRLSLTEKLVLREKTSQCLEILCDMLEMGHISVDGQHIGWLLQETACLHWSVQYRLLSVLKACGYQQYTVEWRANLQDQLMMGATENLTTLLLAVSLDPTLAETITSDFQLDYTDVISALVQVWPNLLSEECERVVMFLEILLGQARLPIAYRLGLPSLMPLSHWTPDHGCVLGVSQVLRDMVLTLIITGSDNDDPATMQMLAHAVQNYVAVIKVRCERTIKPAEGHLFVLSQIFSHICEITHHLPHPLTDITWVLLLNLTSQFTDLCKGCRKMADLGAQQVGANEKGPLRDIDTGTRQMRDCKKIADTGTRQMRGTGNQQIQDTGILSLQSEESLSGTLQIGDSKHQHFEDTVTRLVGAAETLEGPSWTQPIADKFSRNMSSTNIQDKLTKNWEKSMVATVERLGHCEEQEMILKKLKH